MARLSPQSVKRCSRAVIRVTQTSIFFRNDGSNLFEKVKVLKKNVLQTAIQFHVIRKTRLFSLTRLQMKIQHVRTLILERYSDNCRPDLNHCWVVDVLGLEALVFLHLLRKRWFFLFYNCILIVAFFLEDPDCQHLSPDLFSDVVCFCTRHPCSMTAQSVCSIWIQRCCSWFLIACLIEIVWHRRIVCFLFLLGVISTF